MKKTQTDRHEWFSNISLLRAALLENKYIGWSIADVPIAKLQHAAVAQPGKRLNWNHAKVSELVQILQARTKKEEVLSSNV